MCRSVYVIYTGSINVLTVESQWWEKMNGFSLFSVYLVRRGQKVLNAMTTAQQSYLLLFVQGSQSDSLNSHERSERRQGVVKVIKNCLEMCTKM